MIRKSVVLPQPLGPRKQTSSPGSMASVTSRSATKRAELLGDALEGDRRRPRGHTRSFRDRRRGRLGRHHLEEARAVALRLVAADAVRALQLVAGRAGGARPRRGACDRSRR